jgi:hypothetical protein
MSERITALEALESAREMRTHFGDDLMLLIHYSPKGGESDVVLVVPEGTSELPTALALLRESYGDPGWIVVVADSYMEVRTPGEDAPMPVKGELARRFATGDATISEALIVTSVDASTIEMGALRYVNDDGALTFADPIVHEGPEVDGFIPDCLRAAFAS